MKRIWIAAIGVFVTIGATVFAGKAAADAPAWVRASAGVPIPQHDEKADAILLYSEDVTSVQSDGKVKSVERKVYRILRPGGREYAYAHTYFDGNRRITGMRGWCVPQQGKDYEIKDKEAMEISLAGVQGSELVSDIREKVVRIPAAEPGNTIGFEIETEERPYILQDWWAFQKSIPVVEARYTLELPPGWEYKAVWLNHAEVAPTSTGGNRWQWVVKDVPEIRVEEEMPPFRGVAAQLVISFLPAGGMQNKGFVNWGEMGKWQAELARGRRDASPEIKQKVAAIAAAEPSNLGRMRAAALFLQHDIRYVAIELGIGGWQPHAANDIFKHRYGDCKDKATLMSSMLREMGIDSYYIAINTTRGGVTPQTPPMMYWFNHVILAIKLPDDVKDASLISATEHAQLGKLLIFDPTDELTAFGELRGELQANYGLLVTNDGGELLKLPQLAPATNGIIRTARLKLAADGTVQGDIKDVRTGDRAAEQRWRLRNVTSDVDRIKPIETLLASSLASYRLTKATVANLKDTNSPLEFNYSLTAPDYAKHAGNLLLIRPRLLGNKSSGLLETKEARKNPVEFEGPVRDKDTFEVELPTGYEVDDLPPPTDVDYSFGSYHSKTELAGNTLRYTRTYEIKELSVPMSKMDELKKFYRVIASDERNTAVLKPKP